MNYLCKLYKTTNCINQAVQCLYPSGDYTNTYVYCTVHCLICNYHQLEMIINSLAMADGSSNDFKILMNYQSCIAKLITNLLKYYHWNFRWNSTHFCRLIFNDMVMFLKNLRYYLKDLSHTKEKQKIEVYFLSIFNTN